MSKTITRPHIVSRCCDSVSDGIAKAGTLLFATSSIMPSAAVVRPRSGCSSQGNARVKLEYILAIRTPTISGTEVTTIPATNRLNLPLSVRLQNLDRH